MLSDCGGEEGVCGFVDGWVGEDWGEVKGGGGGIVAGMRRLRGGYVVVSLWVPGFKAEERMMPCCIPRGGDHGPRLVQKKKGTSPDISVGTASCMENTRNHTGAKSSRVIVEFACRVQRSTSLMTTRGQS